MAGTYYRPSARRGSGAGVLGRRIATSWVAAGCDITIRDPNADQRNGALQFINNNIANFAEVLGDTNPRRGQFAAFEDLDTAVKNAWFVVEAVPEKLNLKISTFGDLARKAPKDCIFGSNSSSFKSRLMLADMDVESKKRALNVHCTMPPGSRIVELMTSTHTYDEIFPFLVQKHKEIGLLPAVALRESTGFIINRLWAVVKRKTMSILAEGVSGDVRVENGSLRWMDADGLDTVAFIEDNYIQERGLSGKNTADWLRKNYVNEGKLGAKSGHGGLYLAGYATKPATQEPGHHDNLAAPTLYALDLGLGENIYVTDGKTARTLVDGLSGPDGTDISFSEGRIFWTNMGIPSENNGSQLCIDHVNKKLYFCDHEGLQVHRVNFDGSQHEIIIQTGHYNKASDKNDQANRCVGIAVDPKHGKFYWTQKGFSKSGKGRILRANITMPSGTTATTRSDIETLFDNLPEPIDLEIDSTNENLYWTNRGEYPFGNSVNRGYVGSENKKVAALQFTILTRHLHEAIGLRLDMVNKHIYFVDMGGSLYRSNLAGKNKTVIYSGRATFTRLALAHIN
ncbi:3-hydroxyacyl-CoA dehydrogenase family protein [Aspergillus alliaceus]|uniref:3-hydroxyacyl-CoA dehydrogenase family protein n=1 Tax=Petromyces alliaceus TaxID=209559 RepID=UPI0012A5E9ED|nr:uncharacterized protein BDW43DRAFT_318796 [Aspergillus alliaceus]KAB8234452.1 hypothetical protein BDW43DRAFT_318796 [Aspergillus alliaceus]